MMTEIDEYLQKCYFVFFDHLISSVDSNFYKPQSLLFFAIFGFQAQNISAIMGSGVQKMRFEHFFDKNVA